MPDIAQSAARRAVNRLRQRGVTLPDDALEDAEGYASLALSHLSMASSYDPEEHAPIQAGHAVQRWVEAELSGGNPEADAAFLRAADAWTEAAAAVRYRDEVAEELREDLAGTGQLRDETEDA